MNEQYKQAIRRFHILYNKEIKKNTLYDLWDVNVNLSWFKKKQLFSFLFMVFKNPKSSV